MIFFSSIHMALFQAAGGIPNGKPGFHTASVCPETHKFVPLILPQPLGTKSHSSRDCRLWQGRLNKAGYGVTDRGGRSWKAHRLVWESEVSEIPKGLEVAHLCRRRGCVNPRHTYLASHWLNMSDMVGDGTTARGTRGSASKLSEDQVIELRRMYHRGIYYQRELADKFGVARQTVSSIVRGLSYFEVGGPIAGKAREGSPTIDRRRVQELAGSLPTTEIARRLGCSSVAVNLVATELGLDTRPKAWFHTTYPELFGMTPDQWLRAEGLSQ